MTVFLHAATRASYVFMEGIKKSLFDVIECRRVLQHVLVFEQLTFIVGRLVYISTLSRKVCGYLFVFA